MLRVIALHAWHRIEEGSGNAQVDEKNLATPHDRTIANTPAAVEAYTSLLTAILSHVPSDTHQPVCLVQISHAGLQSSSTINFSRSPWTPAIGPCSARPDTGSTALGWLLGRIVWPTKSREIVDFSEWLKIVDLFVNGAKAAEEAGWDGVQIHSAHGYLLAEFLSPLVSDCGRCGQLRQRKLTRRRIPWPVRCQVLRPRYPTVFICCGSYSNACKKRPTRSSSRRSRSTAPTLSKEVCGSVLQS